MTQLTTNTFVFDIETVPDVAAGRKLYHLNDLDDAEAAQAMFALRRETHGTDFLPHYLQRIVAISIVFRGHNRLKVWSVGDLDANEKTIIERFYDGIDKYKPNLISWNGSGFDLPVLHYRALFHGVVAPRYWETGDEDQSFRWNNYLSRYHYRHMDLMDILSGYQPRASAPLDNIATILGFPGKQGMDGSKVWEAYQQGRLEEIRNYCETDVLNTYLVYLRFELMRGRLDSSSYAEELQNVRSNLQNESKAHLQKFLEGWANDGE